LSQFASENEYNLHVDSTMKCAIVNYDKTGQATYGVLSSRSLYRGMDPEKRWIQTYCLLFPSEGTVPSPCESLKACYLIGIISYSLVQTTKTDVTTHSLGMMVNS
jgi:hypothetical protein